MAVWCAFGSKLPDPEVWQRMFKLVPFDATKEASSRAAIGQPRATSVKSRLKQHLRWKSGVQDLAEETLVGDMSTYYRAFGQALQSVITV